MSVEKTSRLYSRLVIVLAMIVICLLVLWQKSVAPKATLEGPSPAITAPETKAEAPATTAAQPGAPTTAQSPVTAKPVAPPTVPARKYQSPIPLGLDLSGGIELLYRIRTEGLTPDEKRNVTQRTIDIIRKRIDPEGRLELDIRPRGNYRFYIQLPGMSQSDASRIEDLIRRAGKLRFCLVNDSAEDRATAERGELVSGFTPFIPIHGDKGKTGRWRRATVQQLKEHLAAHPEDRASWLLVGNQPVVTGEYLGNPHATTDEMGLPAVGFQFTGRGRYQFEKATEDNIGKSLAIILDEDLYSAPRINSRISGPGIIQGRFTAPEVEDLVSTLRAGQLPADIEMEYNNTVGAQLGEDSIRSGIRASVVALILVVAFMTIYYFVNGMIANFAVLVNLLFVLGIMAAMQSVLTLPGIAGLVLTLGMAVDANVLINERIREESARGKTLRMAVAAGYKRAFSAIFDGHITSIITGLILFGVGTGPVRGFATTLTVGLIISLFTSVWVTHWILELLIEKGWMQKLHQIHLVRHTNIRFSRMRLIFVSMSFLASIIGLAVFFHRGDDKYDTDLTGGFRAVMELKHYVKISDFRKRVGALFANADVQGIASASEPQSKGKSDEFNLFSIRIRTLTVAQRAEKMRADLAQILGNHNVGPTVTPSSDPKQPWQFSVQTKVPVTEEQLRTWLREKRYGDADIQEIIVGEPAVSREYRLLVKSSALSERNPEEQIARILKPLEPLMTATTVRPKVSEPKVEEAAASPSSPSARGQLAVDTGRYVMTLRLNVPCSTAAVREALVREVFGGARPEDLRVTGAGADANIETGIYEMAVHGQEKDIQRIYSAKKGDKAEMKVFSFSLPTPGKWDLAVTLEKATTEQKLREVLNEGQVLDTYLRAIIPVGVPATNFTFLMNPLSEEKAVERIKDDLSRAFASELIAPDEQKIAPISFEPTDPPAFASDQDRTNKAISFYKLVCAPMTLGDANAAFLSAGLADSMVVQGDINKTQVRQLKTDRMPVYVKLPKDPQAQEKAVAALKKAFYDQATNPFRSIEAIGPVVAGEMKNKALLAIFLSWAAIIFYLWFRFGEMKFGVAAVVALVHDVTLTAGAVAVADQLSGTWIGNMLGFSDIKVNVTMIAAFLTLIGYSVNDTIVVFDRIRENMGGVRRRVDAELVDTSVNQMLGRTVLTAVTVFLVTAVLYALGGPVIHGFAFVMLFGVLVGTYSSVFIAAPILIDWETFTGGLRNFFRVVTFRG